MPCPLPIMFRRLLRLLHPLHLLLILAWANLSACTPAADPEGAEAFAALQLSIEHRVGEQPFRPGQSQIETVGGERLRVDSLRYYLSNLRLVGGDGQVWAAPSDPDSDRGYFLIDAADPARSSILSEDLAPGRYAALEFLVGVDATRNHAGAQAGALDPAHGLFWTWHTGYIFFALEGRGEPEGRPLELHVGGDDRYARSVRIELAPPLELRAGARSALRLQAQLDGLLSHQTPAPRLADIHGAAEPAVSAQLAERYARMFRLAQLDLAQGS